MLIREWVVSISTLVAKAAPTCPPDQVLIDSGMSASTTLTLISYSIIHSSSANRSAVQFVPRLIYINNLSNTNSQTV